MALTDELTGLHNRRYLFAHLDELMARVNEDGIGAALLMFDIDHFKRVNDTYGHAAGDEVLRQIACRALSSVRSVDLVARLGGEEFAIVMPETGLSIAAAVAERLRLGVASEPFALPGVSEPLTVTISIGVTTANSGYEDRERFLERADQALYEAKATGRNRIVARAEPAVLQSARSDTTYRRTASVVIGTRGLQPIANHRSGRARGPAIE